MVKYLRTKANIYKVLGTTDKYFEVAAKRKGGSSWRLYREDPILVLAMENLDSLIDGYIVIPDNFPQPLLPHYLYLGDVLAENDPKIKNIYGAIWIVGKYGEPILKPVAKVNEDGNLQLLSEVE